MTAHPEQLNARQIPQEVIHQPFNTTGFPDRDKHTAQAISSGQKILTNQTTSSNQIAPLNHSSCENKVHQKIPFTHQLYANDAYRVGGKRILGNRNQGTPSDSGMDIDTNTGLNTETFTDTVSRADVNSQNSSAPTPGDERFFYIRNVLNPSEWIREEARLMWLSEGVAVWFRIQDIGDYYRSSDISLVVQRLLHETGSESIQPEQGILPFMESAFGTVPGDDNDLLHLLFLDIQDRFEETGSYVAGFFDPVNGLDHPFSNRMNLLYIDLYPGFYTSKSPDATARTEAVTATIAHELQHAIHSVIPIEGEVDLFINEGFSELAEILTGHPPRDPTPYFEEPLRSLFSWDYAQPLPDYSRTSLFFHYLFEQVGGKFFTEFLREFHRRELKGLPGVRNALRMESDRTLETIFLGWGQALLGVCSGDLSAKGVWMREPCSEDGRPSNGYRHLARADLRFPWSDRPWLFPHVRQAEQPNWSHQWMVYPFVSHVEITRSATDGEEHWTSLLKKPTSNDASEVHMQVLSPGSSVIEFGGQTVSGSYPHQTMVLLRSKAGTGFQGEDTFLVHGTHSAKQDWQSFGEGKPVRFDGMASYLLLPHGRKIALEFERNTPAWLRGGRVQLIHLSEVTGSGVPADTPREVRVSLLKQTGNGWHTIVPPFNHRIERESGMLFFEDIRWPDAYDSVSEVEGRFRWVLEPAEQAINLFAIGMQPMTDSSGAGRQTVVFQDDEWSRLYIVYPNLGLENWGAVMDVEWVVPCCFELLESTISATMKSNPGQVVFTFLSPEPIASNRSSVVARLPDGRYAEGRWINPSETDPAHSLAAVFPLQTGGMYHVSGMLGSEHSDHRYKVYAEGSIDTSQLVQVTGNYPNPFHPSTRIQYTILEQSDVRFLVFDLLGREILAIPMLRSEPGEHQIEVDLSGHATGMYLVRAESTRLRDAGTASSTAKILMVR